MIEAILSNKCIHVHVTKTGILYIKIFFMKGIEQNGEERGV